MAVKDIIEKIDSIGNKLISNGKQHNFAGLITNWYDMGKYQCTPLNTVLFAFTGSGGVHFSYLDISEKVSPIIMTVPSYYGNSLQEYNIILAENIMEFLGLGYFKGWVGLENYVYNPENTLLEFSSFGEIIDFGNPNEKLFLEEIIGEINIIPYFLSKDNIQIYYDKYFNLLEFDKDFLNSL